VSRGDEIVKNHLPPSPKKRAEQFNRIFGKPLTIAMNPTTTILIVCT
jgi:hypothetical protein